MSEGRLRRLLSLAKCATERNRELKMKEVKLSEDEYQAIQTALRELVVKGWTGELGMMHGANRFISTNICLKKQHRAIFDSACRKFGLGSGIRIVKG